MHSCSSTSKSRLTNTVARAAQAVEYDLKRLEAALEAKNAQLEHLQQRLTKARLEKLSQTVQKV